MLAAVVGLVAGAAPPSVADDFVLLRFEQYLDSLREQAGIRGLSAAVSQDGRIAWERGFGLADVEGSVAARPDTPYPVGGLTQPLSATLILTCAERGRLDIEQPLGAGSASVPEPGARVRHVLSHTSHNPPGTSFKYDEARFAALTPVVDRCSERAFRDDLDLEVIRRLGLVDTVPGLNALDAAAGATPPVDPAVVARWESVLRRLAKPYRVDARGRAAPSSYPSRNLDAASGLVSTVRDLLRFDVALDEGVLLKPDTLALAWTNPLAPDGRPLPSGMGWFVQTYQGQKVLWHFGYLPDAGSALLIKVPARRLTMVLLANTDGLTAPFPLAAGDLTVSPFGRLFLRLFL